MSEETKGKKPELVKAEEPKTLEQKMIEMVENLRKVSDACAQKAAKHDREGLLLRGKAMAFDEVGVEITKALTEQPKAEGTP